MRPLNDLIRELTTWGTPACGLLCGVLGAIAALLWIALGFWRMLFVTLLCAVGAFLGGVKDKQGCIRKTINRIFPPKDM